MKNNITKPLGLNYHYLALFAILLFYLISHLRILGKPGLQEDEANIVVPAMELAYGKEISYGYSFNHFGIHYPTMVGFYTGNNLTIPVALLVRVFGYHLRLVRLVWVFASIGVILLVFLVCRELFNETVGLIASLLLAINPSFWMFSHVGAHVQTNMMLDIMGSLFFFLLFYRTQRRLYLFLGMFLLGHGLYTKLAFGYFLIAYLIAFAYVWIRGSLKKEFFSLQNLSISLAAFLFGVWPLLYFTVTTGAPLQALKRAFTGKTVLGESNLAIGQNFLTRLQQLRDYLLAGGAPSDMILAGLPVKHNLLMPYVFWISFLFLVALIVWPGPRPFSKERLGFILLVICVYQALIIFTPSTLNYAVFAFIPPYIAMTVALAIYLLHKLLSSSRFPSLRWMPILGLVLLGYSEISTLSSQYKAVYATGGRAAWSSTIFQLTDYLQKHPKLRPIGLDWGLGWPVYVISDLQVNPWSVYWSYTEEAGAPVLWPMTPPPEFSDLMSKLIHQPENVYLAKAEHLASFKGRLAALEKVAVENGAKLVKVQAFSEADGQEVILVYKVKWPNE
jgi:4-amino-4-deoxy-L-arabinose transferase-like glycosyltransferase